MAAVNIVEEKSALSNWLFKTYVGINTISTGSNEEVTNVNIFLLL